MMKRIFEITPSYGNFYQALSQNDMPPTLYSLMESKINYQNDNPISIENLPLAFKDYLFDFNYPLDSQFKSDFEVNFLSHYMFRRINYDTYLSFKIHLKNKLNEIMPKYNKMFTGFNGLDFLGDRETINRILNDDRTGSETTSANSTTSESGTVGNTSSGTATGSVSGTNDNRYSDTPQNTLSDVRAGSYVTDYTYNQTSSNTSDNTSTTSNSTTSSSSQGSSSGSRSTTDNIDVSESIVKNKLDNISEYEKYLKVANDIYSLIYRDCDSLFYGLV